MLHLNTTVPEREAIASVTDRLEQAAVIKGQRARYLARKLLATHVDAHAHFLARVAAVYGGTVAQRLHDAFWLAELEGLVAAESIPATEQGAVTHG